MFLNKCFVALIFSLSFMVSNMNAQLNIGVLSGYDLYQRWVNPVDGSGEDRSAGSVILNSSLGLKAWVGGKNFSVSVESYANLGFLTLNVEEYFGMGSLHIPVLVKLNFKGLSGLNELKTRGYSIGGGWQLNKTEFYRLNEKAIERGVKRPYYSTYVIELSTGNGTKSKLTEFFVRFGLNPDTPANSLNIGVNTSFSIPYMKKPKFNMTPGVPSEEEEIIKM